MRRSLHGRIGFVYAKRKLCLDRFLSVRCTPGLYASCSPRLRRFSASVCGSFALIEH